MAEINTESLPILPDFCGVQYYYYTVKVNALSGIFVSLQEIIFIWPF